MGIRDQLCVSAFCLLASAFCLLALPLSLFHDRFAVESYGASRQMPARIEPGLVIASGPDVVAGADVNHSRLDPVSDLARRPDLQIRVNAKVHVAKQVLS